MDNGAEFRGVQREVIDVIVAVVAGMLTGAGRSMLFILPVWAEHGGCGALWTLQRLCWLRLSRPSGRSLRQFLDWLRAMRQLDCTVIDECYIALSRQYGFCKKM